MREMLNRLSEFLFSRSIKQRFGEREGLCALSAVKLLFKEPVKFQLAAHLFIHIDTHNDKVALTVFCDKNRFRIGVAEFGNFIVTVSQVDARSYQRHDLSPPIAIVQIISYSRNNVNLIIRESAGTLNSFPAFIKAFLQTPKRADLRGKVFDNEKKSAGIL